MNLTIPPARTIGYYLLRRIKEPSTWAGGSLFAIILTNIFGPVLGSSVLSVGAAIAALVSILLPEATTTVTIQSNRSIPPPAPAPEAAAKA